MSRRTTTIVQRHVPDAQALAASDLDEHVELIGEWQIELDDELRIVVESKLTHVTIQSRGWDGAKRDQLRISAAQLHELSDALRQLYELDDELHLDKPVDVEQSEIEQPDASTGQTFNVDESSIIGSGE